MNNSRIEENKLWRLLFVRNVIPKTGLMTLNYPKSIKFDANSVSTCFEHHYRREKMMFPKMTFPHQKEIRERLECTLPVLHLKQLVIHTAAYDFFQVECFLTYAVNYIGQKYLKKYVVVFLYGDPEKLHPNLRNNLTNLCRRIHRHEGHNTKEEDYEVL